MHDMYISLNTFLVIKTCFDSQFEPQKRFPMPRGKLILICQSGGEFVSNDDGSLSYIGGEAHALDINLETVFDDMKLKLAEMCNLEYESLSMKYFIPGNKRTLITVSSDKDLKRMFDIHGNSITADVYVMGREGFKHEAYYMQASRYIFLPFMCLMSLTA